MKIEELFESEEEELLEYTKVFGIYQNFLSRIKSRDSSINGAGNKLITSIKGEIEESYSKLVKGIIELAKKDLESMEHKEMVDKKVIENPNQVAILIFKELFDDLAKRK